VIYSAVKRIIDILVSLLAIVCSSPIWLMAIVGIEISNPGPVFYRAKRIGKNNEEFSMYKFRSMRVPKTTESSTEVSLRPETNRIFIWGKVIRTLKIDELPQFLNVLLGNMSIVGPRPVAKDQIHLFRFGKYDSAKEVKPGITGPAALFDYVYGDQFDDSAIDEYMTKVYPIRRELEYVYKQKMSFVFDAWMVLETALCILYSIFRKENTRLKQSLIKMAQNSDPSLT